MAKRIAYQGILGSFSSIAARSLFGANCSPLETSKFRDIFEHVSHGRADYGVVPIENALAGSVHENYDLLSEYRCFIVSEAYCPVQLHLLGGNGEKPLELAAIKKVVSHPKALEQCSFFLEQHEHIEQVIFSDTAGAALYVKRLNSPSIAAIASEEASSSFNLPIIARSVQNHALNATRFVAISAAEERVEDVTKCSLITTLTHEPGSLYTLLGEVARLGINLTKIESRPISGQPFQYAFHLDLQCEPGRQELLERAAERIRMTTNACRVLGFYRAGPTAVSS